MNQSIPAAAISYARLTLHNGSIVELDSRSARGALATVVHMVDARFVAAGGVPANKITSPCH